MRELRIAADGLVDPADVSGDTCDDALSTGAIHKTVDANDGPRVLLISACQWTSAVTLTIKHHTCLTGALPDSIGVSVGVQSTLGGKTFLPENTCMKN